MNANPAGDAGLRRPVTVPYFSSIINLLNAFRRTQPSVSFELDLLKKVSIAQARNAHATKVLQGSYSHLLFVDADMGFQPSLVSKMLEFDRPVVGCVYPRRNINLARALAAAQGETDPNRLRHSLQDYVPSSIGDEREGDFARADVAGTGIMLIRRDALERMQEGYPNLVGANGDFHPFAETVRNPDGGFVGEDVAFCRRWLKIGGEIWVCLTETITHIGRERFVGAYQATIET